LAPIEIYIRAIFDREAVVRNVADVDELAVKTRRHVGNVSKSTTVGTRVSESHSPAARQQRRWAPFVLYYYRIVADNRIPSSPSVVSKNTRVPTETLRTATEQRTFSGVPDVPSETASRAARS